MKRTMPLELRDPGELVVVPKSAEAEPTSTGGLVATARRGDSFALNRLFGRYLPRLRRWASGRLPRWARDISDTADLVQDALLNTLRRFDRFEPRGRGTLEAYLRRAVINNVYLEHRRAAGRPNMVEVHEQIPSSNSVSQLDRLIGDEAWNKEGGIGAGLPGDLPPRIVSAFEFPRA